MKRIYVKRIYRSERRPLKSTDQIFPVSVLLSTKLLLDPTQVSEESLDKDQLSLPFCQGTCIEERVNQKLASITVVLPPIKNDRR